MNYTIETEQADDGRWIAEVMEIPGVIVYGQTRDDAIQRAELLATQTVQGRLAHEEAGADLPAPINVSIGNLRWKSLTIAPAFFTFGLLKLIAGAVGVLAYAKERDYCVAAVIPICIPFLILTSNLTICQLRMSPGITPLRPFVAGMTVVLGCYLLSFVVPVAIVQIFGPVTVCGAFGYWMSGMIGLWFFGEPNMDRLLMLIGFLPNLLMWYSVCACTIGSYRGAMAASVLAGLAGLTWFKIESGPLLVGYYVWMSSFVLLFFFAAAMRWWTRRASTIAIVQSDAPSYQFRDLDCRVINF